MNRLDDWSERLDAVMTEAKGKTFAYGAFDCALFAADCVLAITGIDYAEELRGYTSKVAAYRIVAKYGSLDSMACALLESESVHPSRATIGDVVLASVEVDGGEQGECFGVCVGVKFRIPTQHGLRSFPMSKALKAWRIG